MISALHLQIEPPQQIINCCVVNCLTPPCPMALPVEFLQNLAIVGFECSQTRRNEQKSWACTHLILVKSKLLNRKPNILRTLILPTLARHEPLRFPTFWTNQLSRVWSSPSKWRFPITASHISPNCLTIYCAKWFKARPSSLLLTVKPSL